MLQRIESPVKGYNGTSANIRFKTGVAIAELNKNQYAYFKKKGYKISDINKNQESEILEKETITNVMNESNSINPENIDTDDENEFDDDIDNLNQDSDSDNPINLNLDNYEN